MSIVICEEEVEALGASGRPSPAAMSDRSPTSGIVPLVSAAGRAAVEIVRLPAVATWTAVVSEDGTAPAEAIPILLLVGDASCSPCATKSPTPLVTVVLDSGLLVDVDQDSDTELEVE